ncbi:major facilitator superfamily domain-containing protein [Scleroderma yunnanense]
MSPRASADRLLGNVEIHTNVEHYASTDIDNLDAVFGGPDKRREVEKKLLLKLDLRVLFLVLIFVMNQLDRDNLAAARLQGLEEDLHMTGQQFNTLISITYAGFIFTQVPSNILLNQLRRPSIYLSYCIILWGVLCISIGDYHVVLLLRFFLGFTEAVYYPGVLLILSTWYKRDELGLRLSYFSCGSSLGRALGSFIASGIFAAMDGKFGYAGWRWLFLIEGTLTCVIAVAGIYLIPDFPTTSAAWLTHDEQILARQRMVKDLCGVEPKRVQQSGLVEALTDWTVWWLAIAKSSATVGQSFGNFFPTLAATLGYKPSITLLLCTPAWLMGMVMSFYVSQHSDTTRERFWHITSALCVGIVGFALGISTMNTAVRYLSLLLMPQSYVAYIIFFAWVSNSIPESSSKRGVALAFINACTGVANVGASYLWPASWGPSYSRSYVSCILAYSLCILMAWVYRLHLIRLNNKAEMNERALGLPRGFRYIT